MHNLPTEDNSCTTPQHRLWEYVLRYKPRVTRFCSSATQDEPCRAGLGTGWVTHREYRREGLYFVLPFLLLNFCVLCGVKSIFSIISAAVLKKQRNKHGSTVRVKTVLLRAVVQN